MNSSDQPCNLVPSTDSTFPIAPYWENIPETLLLNFIIGSILFAAFQLCTRAAWRRSVRLSKSNSNRAHYDPSLITMLYGYRDPERWYVVPRYEFLRPGRRHHNHDLTTESIYVPPKLPLANPIELFSLESKDSKSTEDPSVLIDSKNLDRAQKSHKTIQGSEASGSNVATIPRKSLGSKKSSSGKRIAETVKSPVDGQSESPTGTLDKQHTFASSLSNSFFYPTVLTDEQLQASPLSRRLSRFFASFFRTTDADMIYAKGLDAYEYLLFQRHLILIMLITNLFCLGIILPIHWFLGDNHKSSSAEYSTSFQRTTIKNLRGDSNFYWAHIISCICISGLAILILSSYRESIISQGETQLARRTLLIGNIPPEQSSRPKLLKVLERCFPRCNVEAIQYVYNVSALDTYQQQLDTVIAAKEYCRDYRRRYKQEIMVKPTDVNEKRICNGNCRLCSYLCVCSCYWPFETERPGFNLYIEQELKLRERIQQSFAALIKSPSEYAFVTFRAHRHAKLVLQELTRLKSEALNDRLNMFLTMKGATSPDKLLTKSASKRMKSEKPMSTKAGVLEFKTSAAPDDPLDPKNDPHIRSIRSPQLQKIIRDAKMSTSSLEAKGNKLKSPNNSETSDESASVTNKSSDTKSKDLEPPMTGLGPLTWSVRYAPHPDNVEYDDLLILTKTSRLTILLWQILIIIIFIFFTTPTVLMSILVKWLASMSEYRTKLENLLYNYAVTLLQIITTAVLPALITLISKQIPYEDTASKNHSIMWKVYLFLVLMVIVMPSLGMNSAQALFSSDINPSCMFPTDNGAYYINYVISSMLLSNILELIKPVDIVSYYFLMITSRSKADYENGRQAIEREFSVSLNHTGVLLVFSVVMTYSISCPLIAPSGLIYLLIKHSVDHYNLFNTYFTKKVDFRMQNTIDIFVKTALLLMLFQTMVAISISTGASYFAFLSQIVFFSSLAFLIYTCFYDCTSNALISQKRKRVEREFCACFYLPLTVDKLLRSEAIPEAYISRQT